MVEGVISWGECSKCCLALTSPLKFSMFCEDSPHVTEQGSLCSIPNFRSLPNSQVGVGLSLSVLSEREPQGPLLSSFLFSCFYCSPSQRRQNDICAACSSPGWSWNILGILKLLLPPLYDGWSSLVLSLSAPPLSAVFFPPWPPLFQGYHPFSCLAALWILFLVFLAFYILTRGPAHD